MELPITGQVNDTCAMLMGGIAKVMLGELVEEARRIREERNGDSNAPLAPDHIREAYRRLRLTGAMPQVGKSVAR